MLKSMLCLALTLPLGRLFAETKEDAEFNEDVAAVGQAQVEEIAKQDMDAELAWIAQQQADGGPQIFEAQWGGSRRWVCFARNSRGQTFTGASQSRNQARNNAMFRCRQRSDRCFFRSCR